MLGRNRESSPEPQRNSGDVGRVGFIAPAADGITGFFVPAFVLDPLPKELASETSEPKTDYKDFDD